MPAQSPSVSCTACSAATVARCFHSSLGRRGVGGLAMDVVLPLPLGLVGVTLAFLGVGFLFVLPRGFGTASGCHGADK